MVKNYEAKADRLVLELVKKYPLYSVEKLKLELPEVSRHSIQRVLEKHQLSRIEQRLTFCSPNKIGYRTFWGDLRPKLVGLLGLVNTRLRNLVKIGINKKVLPVLSNPKLCLPKIKKLAILLIVALALGGGAAFLFAKTPQIFLEKPEASEVNEGGKLFVSGRIEPKNALVKINGREASLNGDGTFTASIDIPVGTTDLKIESLNRLNRAKKSQVIRLVSRTLTQEEMRTKESEEVRVQREAADKSAQIERTVNDLLAVKNATSDKNNLLKVLNSRVREGGGFAYVEGEISNLGKENAAWVMITATYYNNAGGVIDTKYGFATDFGRVIKPGETILFETQRTTKKFDYYNLAVSSEREAVAGVATEPTQLPAKPTI